VSSANVRGKRRKDEVRSQVVVRSSAVSWNAGSANCG
jgi:hypothetical protein